MLGLFSSLSKGLGEYRRVPGAALVDVREKDEFAAGHIPGAVNVPLSQIRQITLPRETPLFLYCLRGTRSRRAAGLLKKMRYARVKSIGGIAGYPGALDDELS